MKAFFAMVKTALRQQMQYRSAMLAGVFTQLVFGLIYIMVFLAFYRGGNTDSGMTAAQAVSYVWISQATYRMMPWSGIREIDAMMRDGRIAFELARPQDIYGLWFARSMAMRTAPLLLNTPVLLTIALTLMPKDMRLVLDVPMLPLGVLSLTLGMLVSAAMTTILTGTYFWTISGAGINKFLPMIGSFCAGNILPLAFFPEAVQMVMRALPFASMLDAPLRILVGMTDARQALYVIALQAMWLVLLTVIGKCVLRAGVRKCMVQGG